MRAQGNLPQQVARPTWVESERRYKGEPEGQPAFSHEGKEAQAEAVQL